MKRIKSFTAPPFYFVATPIGNLSEFSPRAIEVLNAVDFICAEDTRTSGILLSHFNIKKPLLSVHKFNEQSRVDFLISKLQAGEKGAYLSDAGYPLVSDPGSILVNALTENNISISVVNGPSAFLPALLGSGLDTTRFTFIGFLHGNKKEMSELLKEYTDRPETLLLYEAPHRVNKTVALLYEVLGERKLVIARELTKLHEEYIYTSLAEYTNNSLELKGELVLVVEGALNLVTNDLTKSVADVNTLMTNLSLSLKDAVAIVSLLNKVKKNDLYESCLSTLK